MKTRLTFEFDENDDRVITVARAMDTAMEVSDCYNAMRMYRKHTDGISDELYDKIGEWMNQLSAAIDL